jgi:hypothetical protein
LIPEKSFFYGKYYLPNGSCQSILVTRNFLQIHLIVLPTGLQAVGWPERNTIDFSDRNIGPPSNVFFFLLI